MLSRVSLPLHYVCPSVISVLGVCRSTSTCDLSEAMRPPLASVQGGHIGISCSCFWMQPELGTEQEEWQNLDRQKEAGGSGDHHSNAVAERQKNNGLLCFLRLALNTSAYGWPNVTMAGDPPWRATFCFSSLPPQHGVILLTVFLTPTQRVSQR